MDRHNENDDMHMKDTQNTEAQEEACAGAEAGDAGDAVQTLPENLESLCHEHVCPNCTEKRDADDARLRAAAEMDNFKKRLKREHEEQIRYAAEKVMSDLLPTLDNLDLALQYGSKDEACKDMLQGVAMTRKLLLEAVARHGLTPVGTAGEAFTPELHEAVGFDAEADVEAGAVARVLQSGYKLGERLLLHATAEKETEMAAWEAENLKPCPHSEAYACPSPCPAVDVTTMRCADCELAENLWLCLECGQFHCGRKQWEAGALPGNGHALEHFRQTGHALAVKVASLQEVSVGA